jgi:hypothetical protein
MVKLVQELVLLVTQELLLGFHQETVALVAV